MPLTISTFRFWSKGHRFAIFAAACELAIVCGGILHSSFGIRPDPLLMIAWPAAFLSALASIFCDRSHWPGILLFWLNLTGLLFPRI